MIDLESWSLIVSSVRPDPAEAPDRILELCVEHLDVSGAGMSVVDPDLATMYTCATDRISAKIEDLQWTLGEGPCVDAMKQGAPVLVGDIENDPHLIAERWPTFLAEAARIGVRGVFSFPLQIGAIRLGVMDLYRLTPGPLSANTLAAALIAGEASSLALLDLRGSAGEVEGDLALPVEMQVHQATGMVQVQLGVSAAEALLRIRSRAYVDGRSLIEVATDVVHRRLRFSQEDL